jgi:hypothetical protein
MIDEADMVADAAILLETAELVAWRASGGVDPPVSIRGLTGTRDDEAPDGTLESVQTVTVLAADVTPAPGDLVEIRGRSCRVTAVRDGNLGLFVCDVRVGRTA